ncbi:MULTISPECIES: hypothetical protein [unclassified Streptomyces]|uniref:hypothetical protein n=1 Tax=unclassified Streptomyces TaxID=2593676 RepID=UPI000B13BF82|nr:MULTISPECIES: hypothetical protein [unclassified Streptomyces]
MSNFDPSLPSSRLWNWLMMHGASVDAARDLMNDYAHELASRIRDHDYDPGEIGPVHVAFQDAADVIDPQASRT